MRMRFWTALLCLGLLGGSAFAQGLVGEMPLRPQDLKLLDFDYRFFQSVTPLGVSPDRKARIRIEFFHPCPPALVHYGLESPEPPILPFYIRWEKARVVDPDEKGHGKVHEATLHLGRLFFTPSLTHATACFRVEAYAAPMGMTQLCDGRFTCHQGEDGKIEIFTIVSGPVVDCATSSSAVISFETDRPSDARVVLEDGTEFASAEISRSHEISLSGLAAGKKYHYRVAAKSDALETASPRLHFRTAPAGPATFRFAAMTDSRACYGGPESYYLGVNLQILRTLLSSAYWRGADLILFPGDEVSGFTTSADAFVQQLQAWKQVVEPIAALVPIYEGMGNHEICLDSYADGSPYGIQFDKEGDSSTESLFAQAFVNPENGPEPARKGMPPYLENVYFVDHAQVRFVMINTNYWVCGFPEKYGANLEGHILEDQMLWLERVLDEAEQKSEIRHVFVGTHEPIFPTSKHAGDAMWYDGGKAEGGFDRKYVLQCRDRFWKLLVDHPKVVAVINGDEHNYARLQVGPDTPVYPDGSANPAFSRPLWAFVTGGAGAPLYPFGNLEAPWKDRIAARAVDFHYLLFTVSPERISGECIALNGAVLDAFTLWTTD